MEVAEEECERTCLYESFTEYEEVVKIIEAVGGLKEEEENAEREADCLYESYARILDKYQQQPQLVDAHLKSMVDKLLDIVYKQDVETTSGVKYHLVFKFLYHISKLRGHKTIVRYFPHEVTDLEPVLLLLSKQCAKDLQYWQTNYILLLWLSIIVVIPFHLKTFDPNKGDNMPVMLRIFNMLKDFLPVHGRTHEAAAFLAARFLSRPEIKQLYLSPFVEWCLPAIDAGNSSGKVGNAFGVLLALAYTFKLAKREDVIPFGSRLLQKIQELDLAKQKHEVFVKLVIKLTQRIGLSFLKSRTCTWRYSRGKRCLVENVSSKSDKQATVAESTEIEEADDDFECDNLDQVQTVVEILLTGLRDPNTCVRWSAAKGIGRITSRLSKEMGRDVVGSVLELLDNHESNSTWHGACLALAELGRRGLILPEELPETIEIVSKALVYDELKGNYSLGAHVRDAACYVYWSYARAYDKQVLQPYVEEMSTNLLTVALFDREINCRRAAAAAFQENVGRQGNFPNGIEIVTTVDHLAVGRRKNAFVNLSKYVGQFETYTKPLMEHLVEYKIIHCDPAVRRLSAKAMRNLVLLLPETYVVQNVLPRVVAYCKVTDLNKKHGGIAGLGYLIHGLHQRGAEIPREVVESVKQVTADLKKRRSHEVGGELLKEAGCLLIKKLSIAKISDAEEELTGSWTTLLKDALAHSDPSIRDQAVKAFVKFCDAYLDGDRGKQDQFFGYLLGELRNSEEAPRIGALNALGSLPESMIEADIPAVLMSTVIHYLQEERASEAHMTSARAAAVKCLSSFMTNLNPMLLIGLRDTMVDIFSYLIFTALEDYTEGSRGDIGKPVRLAAITSLKALVMRLHKCMPSLITEQLVLGYLTRLLAQCVSPQDEVREVASTTVLDLLYSELKVIPEKEKLLEVANSFAEKDNWRDPSSSFPLFCAMLPIKLYTKCLFKGLVVSVGGLTKSVVKTSREALTASLKKIKSSDSTEFVDICEKFFDVFDENLTDKRLTLPLMSTFDYLISTGLLDGFPSGFVAEMLDQSWNIIKQSSDPKKLLAAASLFCNSVRFPSCYQASLKYLVGLLFRKFPRVRVATADLLYSALITYNDIVFENDQSGARSEAVLQLLTDNEWNKPLAELLPLRQDLNSGLGL